ncbi:MAG: peptidylprolyl isomerase [Pseudomonadaceae bacterium]|nr:peptidylprolyl isomerase [Pseudomonadaceae bacterium]
MKHLTLAFLLALTATFAHAATDRVVAVVNDQIITLSNVAARTHLLERQMGLANPTPPQQEALGKRTLAKLIDEELIRQYGSHMGITVTDAELKQAITTISDKDPNFAPLTKGLENAAGEQLAAEILWDKITAQLIRPSVNISNLEVDQIIEDMTKSRHVVEREISQIFLAATDEKEAAKRMETIKAELAGGADFATLARTYSEDTSAAQGGHMGWFAGGELNPQLEDALDKMQPGQTSNIIRTPLGLHIIKLDNLRTTKPVSTEPVTEMNLILVSRPLTEGESADDAAKAFGKNVIDAYAKPDAVQAAVADPAFKVTYSGTSNLGFINPANLQSAMQQAAAGLKPGRWSAPFTTTDSVGALYLLGTRQAIPPQLTQYRERVRAHLTQNRMELETRRLQRELRQRAFVDIRW